MATLPTLSLPLATLTLSLLLLFHPSAATPRKLIQVQQQPLILKYHKGPLLTGNITVNFLWYGRFSATQRSIVADFLLSLSATSPPPPPSAASWWRTTALYGGSVPRLSLGRQLLDDRYSLGKSLSPSHLSLLASKPGTSPPDMNVVLTSADVTVDGFCSSRCGTHGPLPGSAGFIWTGDSEVQCPGQCAWPFHQPLYGPQTPPLVAPNGDVGMDGVIINLATLLAGAVTNPDGNGYSRGPRTRRWKRYQRVPGYSGAGLIPDILAVSSWIKPVGPVTTRGDWMGRSICCRRCGIQRRPSVPPSYRDGRIRCSLMYFLFFT